MKKKFLFEASYKDVIKRKTFTKCSSH